MTVRALVGVVSLLVVLALVGLLAAKQMKTVVGASPAVGAPTSSQPAAAGNVREQSRQLQQRVKEDVTRALEQGAASRAEATEQ